MSSGCNEVDDLLSRTDIIAEGPERHFHMIYHDNQIYRTIKSMNYGTGYMYRVGVLDDMNINILIKFYQDQVHGTIICFYDIVTMMVDWTCARSVIKKMCNNAKLHVDRYNHDEMFKFIGAKRPCPRLKKRIVVSNFITTHNPKTEPHYEMIKSDSNKAKELIKKTEHVIEGNPKMFKRYCSNMSRYGKTMWRDMVQNWKSAEKSIDFVVEKIDDRPVIVRVSWFIMEGLYVALFVIVSDVGRYDRLEQFLAKTFDVKRVYCNHLYSSALCDITENYKKKHEHKNNTLVDSEIPPKKKKRNKLD